MSWSSVVQPVQAVDETSAASVEEFLEHRGQGPDIGDHDRVDAVLRHQQILEALDNHEHRRLIVWKQERPAAVAYLSSTGTLLLAGSSEAGPDFAAHLAGSGWRVLLGDAGLANRFLESAPRGFRWRKLHAREQRYMATTAPSGLPEPAGLRLADHRDLDVVTELACRLHVEDQMGPPLSRTARAGVAERMRSSIARSATWVVDRGGETVAKIDVSLRTPRRGAQIAGVYVCLGARGQGIAASGVAAVSRSLMAEGLPGVTLHVRADNASGRRAYERAGFLDGGAWTLALR